MRRLRARIRDSEGRLPREIRRSLPEVEQFERRFCLGTVAAAAVAELSSSIADAPPYDETIGRLAAEADAADLPSLSPEDLVSIDLGNAKATSSRAGDAKHSESELQTPLAPSDDDASLVATADASDEAVTSDAPETWETLTVAAPSGIRVAASGDGESDAGAPEALSSTAPDLSSNGAGAANNEASSTFSSESHALNSLAGNDISLSPHALTVEESQLDAMDVELLLKRAAAATSSEDAIIAVVDRNGRILGVRAEAGVLTAIPNSDELVFAIDGAVAKARTAALFSSGEPAKGTLGPLTSRTVRFISQSTVTEREVESNPNVDAATAATSTERGPGFVAPIGVGGHFPPEVINTPLVDLFAIEHTNRDSNNHPGADGVKGTLDDLQLRTNADGTGRFNIDPAFVPLGQGLFAPESYGAVQNSGLLPDAQSRGIATLPGGIPLFRDSDGDGCGDTLIGGIGVFFPGPDGFATHEQGFVPGVGQTEAERTNASKVLEAEYIAFAAAGGSKVDRIGDIAGCPPVEGLDFPVGRIDLVGITLESIGPGGSKGVMQVLQLGQALGEGDPNSGADQPLLDSVDGFHRDGMIVPDEWLVTPHASSMVGGLTAAQVQSIIEQGIAAANETRAAIRVPMGSRTSMVFAVTDTNGEILGLYRMPDATTFSIDVAVAKARNVSYYADAADLQPIDQVPGIAAGTAFTNRTFRFLSQPRFPSGIDGTPPPDFSILNDDSINNLTAENQGAPAPVSDFNSVLGHDAFFPMTNFRDPGDAGVVAMAGTNQIVANQNGIVFFPGSTPLYVNGNLVGGLGVSGDGVDQDDVVTFLAAQGFLPDSTIVRADQTFYRSVRLPYQKFLRNPFG